MLYRQLFHTYLSFNKAYKIIHIASKHLTFYTFCHSTIYTSNSVFKLCLKSSNTQHLKHNLIFCTIHCLSKCLRYSLKSSPQSIICAALDSATFLAHANKTALYSSMKWGSLRSTWTGKCTVVNIAAQT